MNNSNYASELDKHLHTSLYFTNSMISVTRTITASVVSVVVSVDNTNN